MSELLIGAGSIAELTVTDNGEVKLTATDTRIPTDAGTVIASGDIDVSGDTAGKVQVLGDKVGVFDANINASGTNGGGTVLIGGDYQGVGSILNGSRTYISSDSVINVDALLNGDGGRAIAWADGTTGFYGKISARGGSNSGNGGFVEVSGKENLIFRGEVDTSAPQGDFGTLLLDPENIIIVDAPAGSQPDDVELADDRILYDDPGATFTISRGTLEALNGEVILEASNDIVITPGVSLDFADGGDAIAFKADADMDGVGEFLMDLADDINTNGRAIEISAASIRIGSVNSDGGNISLTSTVGDITTDNLDSKDLLDGGNITLIAEGGNINTGQLDAASEFLGNGGEIYLEANGNIQVNDTIESNSWLGNSGEITLTSHNGKINTTAGILNSSSVAGNGGGITVSAERDINTADISSASRDGNAGEIALTANSNITIQDIQAFSNGGNGGEITVTSNNGAIETTGEIVNSESVSGNGGDITFRANRNLTLTGILNSDGDLTGGDITLESTNGAINAEQLLLNSGSISPRQIRRAQDSGLEVPPYISASQNGNGGAIALSARDDINITAGIINSSGALTGAGAGGSITFTSSDGAISLEDSAIRSETYSGTGGDLNFNAQSVSLTNSNAIVRTNRDAQAGNINVTATEFVDFNQGSILATQNRGTKPNGNLTIDTQALTVRDGSILSTSAQSIFPTGSGGILTVNADSVEISGTTADGLSPSALASVSLRQGGGGDVRINANQLTVQDGGSVLGSTVGEGQGGNVVIKADSVIVTGTSENQLFGSSLSVDTLSNGKAGNLTIEANRLLVQDGGLVSASTFGSGNGGTIKINAAELTVSGASLDNQIKSGIYAQSFNEGNAGSIDIVTGDLLVQDGAKITVNSEPTSEDSGNLINKTNALVEALKRVPELDGIPPDFAVARGSGFGDAGNITIDANYIFLNNQGQITAVTSSGEGGNINIDVWDLILMRHNSLISATAGTAPAGGNGGNITINAPFIVAVPTENSDITANAYTGNGGSIKIFSQAIFGLKFRPHLTPLSDITVSSDFGLDGTFELNTLGIDPSRGLVALPDEPVNTEIDDGCQGSGGQAKVEFFDIGRGGLPPAPGEPFSPDFYESVSPASEMEPESNRMMPQSHSCSLNP